MTRTETLLRMASDLGRMKAASEAGLTKEAWVFPALAGIALGTIFAEKIRSKARDVASAARDWAYSPQGLNMGAPQYSMGQFAPGYQPSLLDRLIGPPQAQQQQGVAGGGGNIIQMTDAQLQALISQLRGAQS